MTLEAMPEPTDLRVKNVLVPLDGSELALQAMPTARVLAQRFDAELQTVSVAEADEDAARLRTLASSILRVAHDDDRVFVAPGGDPADVIAQRADALESSVVCMGTHGRGRFRGAIIGSVARSLLQRSPRPIVALGPMADNPGWSPRPRSWPEPLSVPRIVACVDGTDASRQVLPHAAAWARALEMSLTILTVIDDVAPPIQRERGENPYEPHADVDAYIEHLVEQWRSRVPGADGEVLRDPIGPASAIRTYLGLRPAGLVALTTHARSGMERIRLGAVAASIVHASVAPCLVAAVRA